MLQFHDGSVVQNIGKRLHLIEPIDRRHGRARAGVDKNFVGGEVDFFAIVFVYGEGFGAGEARRAVDEVKILCA
jgi:hypothetical protein